MFREYLDFFNTLFNIEYKYSKTNIHNSFFGFDKQYLVTKEGNYLTILTLQGMEFTNISSEVINKLFNIRKQCFKMIEDEILINIVLQNEEIILNTELPENISYEESTILNLHNNNYKKTFKTRFFIIIQTYSSSKKRINKLEFQEKVNKISDIFVSLFDEYNISRLNNNEILSYYSSYINGTKSLMTVSKDKLINEDIYQSEISFFDDYMVYNNYKKIYSKWISILMYENDTFDEALFLKINSFGADISIYQSFLPLEKEKSLSLIADKLNNIEKFEGSNSISTGQMQDIQTLVQANEVKLFKTRITIQVRNDDLDNLDYFIFNIKKILEKDGFKTVLEKKNIEALYLSNLPDLIEYNPRERLLNSFDISALNSFSMSSDGFNSNSFGNFPMTKFLNSDNKLFKFNLHENSQQNSLGHCLTVAPTGSGKTTFLTFLLSQIKQYPNMKCIILDRFNGTEIFTNYYDGTYIDFDNDVSINPLQLPENVNNKIFLIQFLKVMGQVENDNEEEEIIASVVKNMYSTLDKKERTFKNILPLFGTSQKKGDLSSRMNKWANHNTNHFFNGSTDNLNFNSSITSINMDKVFSDKSSIPLISMYLFHKLRYLSDENKPFVIFIDELKEYLEDEHFLEVFTKFLIQARKLNGIVIGALQDIKFFNISKKAKDLLGSSFASFILFPDPLAKKEYQDTLNLTDNEFNFIKNNITEYQILFKKIKGTSNILNINLAHLGKYVYVFNSDSQNRDFMKDCKDKFGASWKKAYLENR
jgi:type IV secretion/conjugal transfer VirB4 family ATPase